MKQFNKNELIELKYQVAQLIDSGCADKDKDPVSVYYISLEVLQYLDSLGEEKVSQADLQFWAHANQKSIYQMLKNEGEMYLAFKEKMDFEDDLAHAQYVYMHDLHNKKAQKAYYRLVDEVADRRKDYADLRQIAAIYLDILAEDVEGERYIMWRKFHDRISDAIDAKRRGFEEGDDKRLSLPELKMLLDESETAVRFEKKEYRRQLYWQPLIAHLNALIKARQSE